mmetsp:Transcript_20062/g.57288  ORF Transcript_20062/g.57288 Transcript_20062/m.57288 type:complete len:231 (-) Transcript_20062:145-837(-)
MPSTSSMMITRFTCFPANDKLFTASPSTEATIFFERASLAFSSMTSYPLLLATIPAADDLPIPGGPDNSTARACILFLVMAGLRVLCKWIASQLLSQLLKPSMLLLFPTKSATVRGLYLSTHSIISGAPAGRFMPSVPSAAEAAAADLDEEPAVDDLVVAATAAKPAPPSTAADAAVASLFTADAALRAELTISSKSASSRIFTPFSSAVFHFLPSCGARPSSRAGPATK